MSPAFTALAGELQPVVLVGPLLPHLDAALSGRFRFLKAWEPIDGALAASARVLLCGKPSDPVDSGLLARFPSLELVVAPTVGVNHIDLVECRRRGIAVTNIGPAFTEDTADYAVGLLIDVLRRVSASNRYVQRGLWPRHGDYPLASKLGGKHIGIVGLGRIGSAVAKRLDAFGCLISYFSRTRKTSVSYKYFQSITELAAASDVLVISCPLTDQTHHIINKEVMLALGRNGVIINIGRGRLVDEKELVACLMQGEIGGAGFDVFDNEPHVPKELINMDNVVLSPHCSVFTPESSQDQIDLVIANLEAFFGNRPLVSPITD